MGSVQIKSCSYVEEYHQIEALIEDLQRIKGAIQSAIECTKSTVFDSETGMIRDVEPNTNNNNEQPKSEEIVKEKKEEGHWIVRNGKSVKYLSSTSKLTDGEPQPPKVVTQQQTDLWEFNYKREEMLKEYTELLNRIEMALLAMSKLRGCDHNEIRVGEGLEQAKESIHNLVEECTLTINTNAISLITGKLIPIPNGAGK